MALNPWTEELEANVLGPRQCKPYGVYLSNCWKPVRRRSVDRAADLMVSGVFASFALTLIAFLVGLA